MCIDIYIEREMYIDYVCHGHCTTVIVIVVVVEVVMALVLVFVIVEV